MAATTVSDVKRYLWLQGSGLQTSLNVDDLLRELLDEYEKLKHPNRSKRPSKHQ